MWDFSSLKLHNSAPGFNREVVFGSLDRSQELCVFDVSEGGFGEERKSGAVKLYPSAAEEKKIQKYIESKLVS